MPSTFPTVQTRLPHHPALDAWGALHGRVERTLHAAFKAGRQWRGDLQVTLYKRFGLTSDHVDHIRRGLEAKLDAVREGAVAQAKELGAKAAAKAKQADAKAKRLAKAEETVKALDAKREALLATIAAAATADLDGRAAGRVRKAAGKGAAALPALDGKLAKLRRLTERLPQEIHQHRRRSAALDHSAETLAERAANPSLAFGTRALFAAQHALAENGFANHAAWLEAWRAARSHQFVSEGNKAPADGNAFVRLDPQHDGTFAMELRLPRVLAHLADGGYITGGQCVHYVLLRGLRFEHGRDQVAAWLLPHRDGSGAGGAISYRFHRDERGWRVMVTAAVEHAESRPSFGNGALGVDLNEHDAVATLADPHGNPAGTWTFPMPCHGKTDGQRLDIARQVAARIVELARELRVPIVVETLDFSAKKALLATGESPRRARQLSSFAYKAFADAVRSAALRAGVALRAVNPAYTSLIGRLRFAPRYGSSVHAAAALCIARRAMNLSERPPRPVESPEGARPGQACVPARLDSGDLVTLAHPERKARRHVWSSWRRLHSGWNAVHAARARARREARSSGSSDGSGPAARGPGGRGGSPPPRASGGVTPPAMSSGPRIGPARERVRPPEGRREPPRVETGFGGRSTEASR